MAFVFPENKADFTAPNGVTYHWDGIKWRVRSYQNADGSTVYIGEDPDSQEDFNVSNKDGQIQHTSVELFREDIEELLG